MANFKKVKFQIQDHNISKDIQSANDGKVVLFKYKQEVIQSTSKMDSKDTLLTENKSKNATNTNDVDTLFSNSTASDDPALIKYIQDTIHPPPKTNSKLNLNSWPASRDWSQQDESLTVDRLLKSRTDGLFVECGASDGETYSNSLFFETKRNWTGVLIEANEEMFKKMLEKKRNVYALQGCLSPLDHPQLLKFKKANFLGGLSEFYEKERSIVMKDVQGDQTIVKCFPFHSVMMALNITHIDYFSLDTEGSEVAILKTISFDKVRIDIVTIEWIVWKGGKAREEQKIKDIDEIMTKTNLYKPYIKHQGDLYYLRKDL